MLQQTQQYKIALAHTRVARVFTFRGYVTYSISPLFAPLFYVKLQLLLLERRLHVGNLFWKVGKCFVIVYGFVVFCCCVAGAGTGISFQLRIMFLF